MTLLKQKALLVSINGLGEQTGGGIYLRTLFQAFSAKYNLELISKDNLSSGLFEQAVSRLILITPCFIGFHIIYVIREARKSDVVILHNARLGLFCFILKIFFRKKTIVCSDNFEAKLALSRIRGCVNPLKKLALCYDWVLVSINEKLAYYCANNISFITNHDRDTCLLDASSAFLRSTVIPVCVDHRKHERAPSSSVGGRKSVLFTASFSHEPNVAAFKKLLEVAAMLPNLNFLIAGRKLDKVSSFSCGDNVRLVSDPDEGLMSSLFVEANIYCSLVDEGSGMKTKIAEALSYGLVCVSTCHSAIGYEAVLNGKNCPIVLVSSVEDAVEAIQGVSASPLTKETVRAIQVENYSYNAARNITESWLL